MSKSESSHFEKFCFIDMGSATAPFNYFFIKTQSVNGSFDVFCSETEYNGVFIYKTKELEGVTLRTYKISSSLQRGLLFTIIEMLKLFVLVIMKAKSYDRIYLNFPKIILFDLILAIGFRKKIFWLMHNVNRNETTIGKLANRLRFVIYENIVLMSDAACNQLRIQGFYNLGPHHKLFISKHGLLPLIPCKEVESANWRLNENKSVNSIICIGNIKVYKGILDLISLPHLLDDYNLNYKIYGKFQDFDIKTTFEKNGWFVSDGFQSDELLINIITSGSLFILSHLQSSQSGIYYTLMHYRALFIASRCGQQEIDFVKFGLEGLLFDPGNVQSAARAVRYALDNSNKIQNQFETLRCTIEWGEVKLLAS